MEIFCSQDKENRKYGVFFVNIYQSLEIYGNYIDKFWKLCNTYINIQHLPERTGGYGIDEFAAALQPGGLPGWCGPVGFADQTGAEYVVCRMVCIRLWRNGQQRLADGSRISGPECCNGRWIISVFSLPHDGSCGH